MAETNHINPSPSQQQTSNAEPTQDLDIALDTDMDVMEANHANGANFDGAGDGTAAGAAAAETAAPDLTNVALAIDPKITSAKDTTLREFLGKMDEYAPIIPDAVTNYYLTKAGLPPPPHTPARLARLLALATQKFIADIAADAYQYSRIRVSNTSSSNPMGGLGAAAAFQGAGPGGLGGLGGPAGKEGGQQPGKGGNLLGAQRPGYGGGGGQGGSHGRTALTMEDLGMAVAEYGVNVQRGEFYR